MSASFAHKLKEIDDESESEQLLPLVEGKDQDQVERKDKGQVESLVEEQGNDDDGEQIEGPEQETPDQDDHSTTSNHTTNTNTTNTATTNNHSSTMDSLYTNNRNISGEQSAKSSSSKPRSRRYDGYLDATNRYRDEESLEQRGRAGRKIKYKKHPHRVNTTVNINDEESLDPVFSIKGGQSVTSYNNNYPRKKKSSLVGSSIRINEEESFDPTFGGGMGMNMSKRSITSGHESVHSLIGKSIHIDRSEEMKKKPLNPHYGTQGSQGSKGSLGSSRRDRNKSPSVASSSSTYFSDEQRTDIGYLDKYRQYFCIGIVVFFLVDIILLAVFFSPVRFAVKSEQASSNTSSTNLTPIFDKELEINDNGGIARTIQGRFELLQTVPHDINAYTQGLEVLSYEKINMMKSQYDDSSELQSPSTPQNSYFLESTGNYGDSSLRIVEVASGDVDLQFFINDNYFGKGCTYFYDPPHGSEPAEKIRVVQLTWEEGEGFVYELEPPNDTESQWRFIPMGNFKFSDHTTNGKGRGIVYHPLRNQFIVNDGSSFLHFWELTEDVSFTFYTDVDYITTFKFRLVDRVRIRQTVSSSLDWLQLRNSNDMTWDPYSYGGNTILATLASENKVVRIWVGNQETKDDDEDQIYLSESFTTSDDVGKVTHVYDMSSLEDFAADDPSAPNMNLNAISFAYESSIKGMAADSAMDEYWITGSQWPNTHRVRLIDEKQ